jgi:poly-gamma-glutamate synthesis protein (capsule biosynthesis protein)
MTSRGQEEVLREANGEVTRLIAVGDLHPNKEERPESLFDRCLEVIRQGDITFGQIEVLFTNEGELQRFPSATPYIRVPPEYASSLAYAGFDVVSCASNHAMDWGERAMLDSIENIRSQGVSVIGAGRDEPSARQPAVVKHAGNRIAMLAYTSVAPPACYAIDSEAGVAPIRARTYYDTIDYQAGTPPLVVTAPWPDDLQAMTDDISQAKAIADVVIVSLHWGVHHLAKVIADYQPVVAHAAIDAGADLLIGHHPHLLKAIEVYKGKVIFYSIGNFAFDSIKRRTQPDRKRHARLRHYQDLRAYGGMVNAPGAPGAAPPRHSPDSSKTLIVAATIAGGEVKRVSFIPTLINDMSQPVPLTNDDEAFQTVIDYLDWASADFPHLFTPHNGDVVVSV